MVALTVVSGARTFRPEYLFILSSSCKTLEKLLKLSVPHFPYL